SRYFVSNIPQCTLCLTDCAISAIAHFDLLFALEVFLGMYLGITHHPIYLLLGQSAGGSDGDLLLASSCPIVSGNIEDTIRVKVEGYLNLRNASWSRSNPFESKVTQTLVVSSQFALALQHMDLDRGLVIFRRAKNLALACRNCRIAFNQPGHHTTQSLNTKRAGRHIKS